MIRKCNYLFMVLITVLLFSCKKEEPIKDDPNNHKIEHDLTGNIELENIGISSIKVLSEVGSSVVDEKGDFAIASHSILVAVNTENNKTVFLGIPKANDKNYQLNAKETALFFALQAIPSIRNHKTIENVDLLKNALYELEEVKELEIKIQKNVQKNGFLNYDEMGSEIGLVLDMLYKKLSLLKGLPEDNTKLKSKSISWNDSYSAGRGYYRVSKDKIEGSEDKFNSQTGEYSLKRKFYNTTPAVVGVRLEKYDFVQNIVQTPFTGEYIGFIEPWYPPNLLLVSGNWDNLVSWCEHTGDWINNGWDGFVNTDAYSTDAEFSFVAKKGDKDAFVFTNGYYDPLINGVNVLYVFTSNYKDVLEKQIPDFKEDVLVDFIMWMQINHPLSLANYKVWFDSEQYDDIITDIKSKFLKYVTKDINIKEQLFDIIDEQFEKVAGAYAVVYKYSRKAYKWATYMLLSSSPKFAAAIPIEFKDPILPSYPYQPKPFNVTLANETTYKFEWNTNNTNNQELMYNLYLGKSQNNLLLYKSSLTEPFCNVTLEMNTKYYWQIEVVNQEGGKSKGAIWSFINGLQGETLQRIYFESKNVSNDIRNIFYFDIETNKIHGIFNDNIDRFSQTVSKNKQKMAYVKRVKNQESICVSDLNGMNEQIIYDAPRNIHIEDLDFNPNGDKLIFYYGTGPDYAAGNRDSDIYLFDINSNEISNLSNDYDYQDFFPSFSNLGDKITYTHKPNTWFDWPKNIYIMDSDGTQKILLADNTGFNNGSSSGGWPCDCIASNPEFSKDDSHIIFDRGNNSGIYIVNTDGTNQHKLNLSSGDNYGYHPTYSPNGSKIAFTRNRNLVFAYTNGTIIEEFPATINNYFVNIEWVE